MKMRTEKRAIDKIYKRRDRYEIPDWQREEVWSAQKKENLIDSILRGWKLPKFYFLKTSTDPDEYEVVDGQQRLATIYAFISGDLILLNEIAKRHGASTFTGLSDSKQDAFEDYEIEYDEIEDATEEEIREFFLRLQDGLPLTSVERLNAVFSKLTNFCKTKTKHKFFKNTVKLGNKRYAHLDVIAKAAAIEVEGFNTGLRYEDLRAVFEAQKEFSSNSLVAKRINSALDFLEKSLPNGATYLKNRSAIQSLINLTAYLYERGATAGMETRFRTFVELFFENLGKEVEAGLAAKDSDYLDFQRTVNANSKKGAQIRHSILLRKLFQIEPAFLGKLNSLDTSDFGTSESLKTKAQRVSELVAEVNELAASTGKKEPFKPTTKTFKAISNLSKASLNLQDFKERLDDLYFLLWEGPEGDNDIKDRETFKDIKAMRNSLSHDYDHGKASTAAKKKADAGEIFKKYSGNTTLVAVDPAILPVIQSTLYSAVEVDLRTILEEIGKLQ